MLYSKKFRTVSLKVGQLKGMDQPKYINNIMSVTCVSESLIWKLCLHCRDFIQANSKQNSRSTQVGALCQQSQYEMFRTKS